MTHFNNVLFATDLSTASREAFTAALTLARSSRARLTLLAVIAPIVPTLPEGSLDAATIDRLDRQAHEWATQGLQKLAARARRAHVRAAIQLRWGDPVGEILEAVKSLRANVLVVGTHGRRGLSKVLLGSVAQQLVTHAPCPVLTVRGRPQSRRTVG